MIWLGLIGLVIAAGVWACYAAIRQQTKLLASFGEAWAQAAQERRGAIEP